MKVYVDKETCIGCGLCNDIYPEVFEIDDDGKAVALEDQSEADEDALVEALESCPVEAIREEEN